jgi:hypothetical protein
MTNLRWYQVTLVLLVAFRLYAYRCTEIILGVKFYVALEYFIVENVCSHKYIDPKEDTSANITHLTITVIFKPLCKYRGMYAVDFIPALIAGIFPKIHFWNTTRVSCSCKLVSTNTGIQ